MRHLLSPKHHEHLHKVGIEKAHDLFIVDVNHEHYERQKESWRRTLPLASEEELHMYALASVLWKTQERGKPKPTVKKYRYHWFLLGIIILLIALLYFIWPRRAHAQIVEVQGAGKGSTTSNVATVTPVDANHNAIDVNIAAGGGTGGGPADAAANAAASESDTARQKVIAVIRLLDTGQGAGSQLVTAKGDQTSGMWVNCKSGCAGGSSTPADTFATPTTAGLNLSFPMLWNGTTFDRLYGDKTNGAFVNIKNSVSLAVTGTFFQATQPVSIADAADVTLGAKADAKSTATDTTAVTIMQVLKEISAMEQAPASRAVTNAGTFAVQAGNFPTTVDTNSGNKSASTLRVVLATDQPALTNKLLVTPDSVALPANQSVNVNQVGGTAVVADPCQSTAKLFVSITQTANTQLVTGTSAKKIYICSVNVVTAAANNVALVEGTGTVCATGIAGVQGFGGSTAATGWNFAANGGIAYGTGGYSVGGEGTNADNLCLLQSAAVQLTGGISYVVQ